MKTSELMKAKTMPVRRVREDIFNIVKQDEPLLITNNGKQEMFLIPYEDVIELMEILEDSKDEALRSHIRKSREEYNTKGGIPFEDQDK